MKQLFTIFLILTISLTETAISQPTFEKVFRINNQTTEVYSVFPMTDGFMLLSQHGKGIINFTKLDINGEFVTGKDIFDSKSGFVMSSSQTSNGDFLVTGVINVDEESGTSSQTGFFLKVNSSLSSVVAFKFLPFAGNGDTWASGAIETIDGSILVLAKSTIISVGGIDNYYEVIKFNSSASEIQWQSAILAGSFNTVFDIAETSAGYEIYGAAKSSTTNWNLYLGTLKKDGKEMLRQLIVGGYDWDGAYDLTVDEKRVVRNHASSIVKVDNNTLAVAAYSRSVGNNSAVPGEKEGKSILLVSYPVTGDSYKWAATLDGGVNDMIVGPFGGGNFISLANGDVLLSGYTSSKGQETPYPGGFMYRFAINGDGGITPRWQHVFTPGNNLNPLGVAEAKDGTLLLSGRSTANTAEGVVIQTTSDGLNPVGCISVNHGNMELKSTIPSVLSTTNSALFDGTLILENAQTLYNRKTNITTICSAQSTEDATLPEISEQPKSQTIPKGETANLTVLSTGTPPLQYQWYKGEKGDISNPVGTDAPSFTTPSLNTTTKYWTRISNNTGITDTETATVSVENVKWIQSNWPDYKELPVYTTLGKDGMILVTTRDWVTDFGPNDWCCGTPPGYLTAIDSVDGGIKWSVYLGHSAPPAVTESGMIYTTIENKFYSVSSYYGGLNLIYTANHNFTSSPAIADNGMVYIGAGQQVLAIDPEESRLRWAYPVDKFVIFHPTIAENGHIIIIPGRVSTRMYTLFPSGGLAWTQNIPTFFSTPPVIGEAGVIYAGAGANLYAFEPELGGIKWKFTIPIAPAGYPTITNIISEPVISSNGTIYLPTLTTGPAGALFAIHPDGYPKWFFPSDMPLYTTPLLTSDEKIYYPAYDLHVLDLYGKEISSIPASGRISPSVGSDGTIYGGSHIDIGIFALEGTSNGPMIAHWPTFGHDSRHTSQYDDEFAGIPTIITVQPENQLITSGSTATFTIEASGDPILTYQWYKGVAGDMSTPVGDNSPTYSTPPISEMTNYWVQVENGFGRDVSQTVMASTGKEGEVKWLFNTFTNNDEDGEIDGGVAQTPDGTIYFVVSDGRLFALNPDGTLKWKTPEPTLYPEIYDADYFGRGAPAVGPDGTIYFGISGWHHGPGGYRNFGFLCAINPDGSEKWHFKSGEETAGEDYSTMPWVQGDAAVGLDGTIYVSSQDGILCALNPDGTVKWKFNPSEALNWYAVRDTKSASVGKDGTIYYVAAGQLDPDNWRSTEGHLFAINPNGTMKWNFFLLTDNLTYGYEAPAIGADGTVYIGNGSGYDGILYAVKPDGTEAWHFTFGEYNPTPVAIGTDGTIYTTNSVYVNSRTEGTFFALNPDGSEKWRFPGAADSPVYGHFTSPAIGADGIIYTGNGNGRLYALKPDGIKLWDNPPYLGIIESPLISPDGKLYAPTANSGQGSIKSGFLWAVNTNSFGLANSSWPMYGRDPLRTNREAGVPPCENPVIISQPQNKTILKGNATTLNVEATGTNLFYRWYEGDDKSKQVGTNKIFTTPDLNTTATYWALVSNDCGSESSIRATIAVVDSIITGEWYSDATLSTIWINNKELSAFNPGTLVYNIELPAGTNIIPTVSSAPGNALASTTITQASFLPGSATIFVAAVDGENQQTYTVNFSIVTSVFDAKQKNGFNLFPNPAAEKFKVQSLKFKVEGGTIELYDLNGRKIIEKQISAGNETIEIDVSHLKNGVYFCRLHSAKNTTTKKIIIQK